MYPDARTGPREVNTEDSNTLGLQRNLATMAGFPRNRHRPIKRPNVISVVISISNLLSVLHRDSNVLFVKNGILLLRNVVLSELMKLLCLQLNSQTLNFTIESNQRSYQAFCTLLLHYGYVKHLLSLS